MCTYIHYSDINAVCTVIISYVVGPLPLIVMSGSGDLFNLSIYVAIVYSVPVLSSYVCDHAALLRMSANADFSIYPTQVFIVR